MAHFVHCSFCKERFDRDKIPAIKISSARYAHALCAIKNGTAEQQALATTVLSDQSQQNTDLENLQNYIINLFGTEVTGPRVNAQIKHLIDQKQYTYNGILKALKYFYEVKNGSIEKANGGIGIVPFVYEDANKYYQQIWLAQQVNSAKPIEQYLEPSKQLVTILPPTSPKRVRRVLFSFLDEEEKDGI